MIIYKSLFTICGGSSSGKKKENLTEEQLQICHRTKTIIVNFVKFSKNLLLRLCSDTDFWVRVAGRASSV